MIYILLLAATISVTDGDTFTIDGEQIRPVGFDAPELTHAQCVAELMLAKVARRRFDELVRSPTLRIERLHCKSHGRRCINGIAHDVYGRTLAKVFVKLSRKSILGPLPPEEIDIGKVMIHEGYARKYRQNFRGKWCK